MLYEVVNPSDPVFLEAEDPLVAAVSTLLLGEGLYGCKTPEGAVVLPLLAFGGDAALESWCASKGIRLDVFLHARKAEVASCLASAALPPGRKRSSLNDICGAARNLAARLAPSAGAASTT